MTNIIGNDAAFEKLCPHSYSAVKNFITRSMAQHLGITANQVVIINLNSSVTV